MIADWRAKWFGGTGGQTDPTFPFGFVQLNSIGNGTVYATPDDASGPDQYSNAFGYGGIRWAQTAGYGYSPNPAMPNVFMATVYDTPDVPHANGPHDAGFNVHSPFKQPARQSHTINQKWRNTRIQDVFCYRIPALLVPAVPTKTRLVSSIKNFKPHFICN